MSLPSPPSRTSFPLEDTSVSLPAPPSSTSSPRMPRRRSLPPSPTRRSAPARAVERVGALGAGQEREPGLDDQRARRPGSVTVRSRWPLNADRIEIVRRPLSDTYSRRASGEYEARPGPPPVGGRAITRRRVRSTSAALRWMPRSLAPGATIARVPSARDADAAAAVGAERDRAGDGPAGRRRSAPAARPGAGLTLARRGRRDPRVTARVDAHAGGAGELQPPHEPAGRQVEHGHLAAGLHHDGARRRDDEVDRRAGRACARRPAARSRRRSPRSRPCAPRTRASRRGRRPAPAASPAAARCRRRCARRGR